MVDYGWSFNRAIEDWKKILIGAVIGLIPIVNLIYTGYLLRVAKTAQGKKKLPEWDQWVEDFVNGLKAAVVAIVYSIPVIIIGFILAKSLFDSLMSGDVSNINDLLNTALGGLAIILILGLLTLFILPAAILRMVFHGGLGEAFKFGEVFKRAFTGEYIITWIVVAIVYIILGFIGGLLGGIIGAKTFALLGSFIAGIFGVIAGFFGFSAFGQLKY